MSDAVSGEHAVDFDDDDDARARVAVVAGPDAADVQSALPAEGGAARLAFVDLFRGVILVIMALDHVKYNFAAAAIDDPVARELYSTPADYNGPASWWLTREVTHLCAVGFAFAMGLGMHFFISSRSRSGWSAWRIWRHYAVRGLLLVLLDQVLDWSTFLIGATAGRQPWSAWLFMTGILEMLGVNLMLGAALLLAQRWLNDKAHRSGDVIMALLVIVLPIASYFAVPSTPQPHVNPVLAFFFVTSLWQRFIILDALLPWLPLVLLGAQLARVDLTARVLGAAAGASLALFSVLRLLFVLHTSFRFGSFRPILEPLTFFSFFGLSKYPPSVCFLALFLGLDLLLLLALRYAPVEYTPFRQLTTLGTAPLCFYCLHLLCYALVAAPFAPLHATTLPGIYLMWMFGVAFVYWPTKAYARFKAASARNSVWRFF